MAHRLLAFVVLLTGLTALHAPAHASVLDRLSYDVETLGQMADLKGEACQCEKPPEKHKRPCPKRKTPVERPRLHGILPPSIVVGADRALE
ncbi:MAG: hypothetical protein QNI87_02540 [Erythrobacter sp.]|uniref:hypothetical protein n=1 Tax=Erythrobacter sp. TaxID=1042 RepID=UPI00262BC43F|nr:hypothetical protein [Erythrobacter sp.]MDJ0977392.1 hypothetical protein [Erythrobacter sp.]